MNAVRLLCVAVGCLLLASVGSVHGLQSSGTFGCSVIDKSRPSIYLTFERSELPAGSLLLSFHNNLNCSVIVETQDINPAQFGKLFKRKDSKLPDGAPKVEYVTDWSSETVLIPLLYDFQNDESHRAPEPANYREDKDMVFTLAIPGARSAVFRVEPSHLKKGLTISVPFYFAWERGPRLEPVVHRVYFESSDLPTSINP
jgi:hypothetical protein